MPARKRPGPAEAAAATGILLDGLAGDRELPDIAADLAALHVPPQARPGQTGEHEDEPGPDQAILLRRYARLYLDYGLLPVPAWGVRPDGQCCCHRSARCQRPGKHPRSIHVGPGEYDYSWKPLACATREEIEQRFADGGEFAAGNLMLAIPPGMLVVDQDDDDGGRQAKDALAEQLGKLPRTLSHRTPHGVHRIYRTPPGWTPRAWVGKDARNPLPPGIDLRVPGQVLMAPPSRIPAVGVLADYGPVTGGEVAELPAAYVSAWTPPAEAARPGPVVSVPPGKADAATAYVNARIAGIIEDLAEREPGGRNTAIYTAALKVGSTLGAARSTPGAENAVAAWPDDVAEDALMVAAERNGYVSDHSGAAARSAVRSGLRNGLRSPRPLPDFSSRPAAQLRDRGQGMEHAGPRTHRQEEVRLRATSRSSAAGTEPRSIRSARPAEASSRDGPRGSGPDMEESVAVALQAGGFKPSGPRQGSPDGSEGFLVQESSEGDIVVQHAATAEQAGGLAPWERADQMLDRYAYELRSAGYDVTRTRPGSISVRGRSAGAHAGSRTAQRDTGPGGRAVADQAATAANAAYRAGDLERARRLIHEAAALDPARGDLWMRHRAKIDAKYLLNRATVARGEGEHAKTQELIGDAARLDPRLTSVWDQDLPGLRCRRREPAGRERTGTGDTQRRPVGEPGRTRERSEATRSRRPAEPALHDNRDPDACAIARRAPQSGDTHATPGSGGSPTDRQQWPLEQFDRGQTAKVRANQHDWRQVVAERERGEWQPRVVAADSELVVAAEPEGAEMGG